MQKTGTWCGGGGDLTAVSFQKLLVLHLYLFSHLLHKIVLNSPLRMHSQQGMASSPHMGQHISFRLPLPVSMNI